MSKKNIFLELTNGIWLIDAQSAEQLGANVARVLNGEKFWDVEHKATPEFLIIGAGETGSFFGSSLSGAKPGSVAVINISGPIMKEDNCGDPGTKTYENLIKQAANNPNIDGIVLNIDSPGGTVAGTQSLSNLINSIDKPVVTLAEDLMASAAYWIGSAADFVFANNGTTRVGSIGTMLSFADMQPVWEAQGVKFHEIYATKSTAKNKDFAEARQGNYDAIKASTLDPLNNEFLNSVKQNRGEKLNQDETLTGKVFTANDALKYGLIDAIGNIEDAVSKVRELAGASAAINNTQSQNTDMKKITLLASMAFLASALGVTFAANETSKEVELTDDLLGKLNAALEDGTKASEKLATAETALKAEQDAHAATSKELSDLKAANPGVTTAIKEGADKIITSNDDEFLTSVDKEKAELKAKGLI